MLSITKMVQHCVLAL